MKRNGHRPNGRGFASSRGVGRTTTGRSRREWKKQAVQCQMRICLVQSSLWLARSFAQVSRLARQRNFFRGNVVSLFHSSRHDTLTNPSLLTHATLTVRQEDEGCQDRGIPQGTYVCAAKSLSRPARTNARADARAQIILRRSRLSDAKSHFNLCVIKTVSCAFNGSFQFLSDGFPCWRAHTPAAVPSLFPKRHPPAEGVLLSCIFETNGLKALYFQPVEPPSAFNTRGQAHVSTLRAKLML